MAAGTVPITIAPVASALLRTRDADYYRRLALDVRVGEELPLDAIEAHLQSIGYERRDPVEMVGEYSIRGGILWTSSERKASALCASSSSAMRSNPSAASMRPRSAP